MKLPSFLFKKVKEHKTSLGNNEAFPPEEDFPFDYKILKTRFEEVINKINEYEDVESLEENYLISLLNKLITQCKEKENPIKEHIEKLCEKIVSETFRIPNETINLNIKLTDKLSPSKQFNLTPPTSKERAFDFEDLNDFKDSEKVILKRRLINSLIQGASYEYSTKTVMHLDEISSLLSDLKPLYERIIAINDFLLFTKKESITDDKIHQGAIVEVLLGRGNEKTEINVQGLTFPFLLNETFRGMFELFAAHGLPQDIDKANYILQQADFLLAEPWDLRMGVTLWNILSENVYGYESMPYFFMTLCEINTDEFNLNLKEVFAQTKKGKQFIIDLNEYALKEAEYNSNIEPIEISSENDALMTDSYISSNDLDLYYLTDDELNNNVIEEGGNTPNKLQLLKEFFGFYGNENQSNADNVIIKDKDIHLLWDDNGAYPFCWIDDELYIGDESTMHSSPALKAVYDDVNNKILNDGCNADIDGTFNDELDGYNEYEFLHHPYDEEYREEYEIEEGQEDFFHERYYLIGDWISYNHTESELNGMLEYMDISGRYWEYDKVISFWSSMTPEIMRNCIKELSERTKIDFSNYIYVYTDYETDEFKYCTISEFINSNEEMEFKPDERENKGIHLMNQQNKRNALSDFRQNRAEVQGRKLGKIPMAQYHNMIYQESVDNGIINDSNLMSENKSKFALLKEGLYDGFDVRDADKIYYNYYEEDFGDEEEPDIQNLYNIQVWDMFSNLIYENDDLNTDELEELLGVEIASKIYNNEGVSNNDEYYPYCLMNFNPHIFGDANETARFIFRDKLTDYFPNLHGFILKDGMCIDLTNPYGNYDHSLVSSSVPQLNDKLDFVAIGNIRCSTNSFDLIHPPTREQKYTLRKLIANSNNLIVDIYSEDTKYVLTSAQYRGNPNPSYVLGEIDRFFDEGINLQGGDSFDEDFYMYESLSNANKQKKIYINESQLALLTESQESKSISAAKKLLMQRLGYDEQQADEFVRVKLRNDLPVLRTPEGGKFILGVTRMYINGELSILNVIGNLNSTLKLIASDAHINEYDRNLNGMSAIDLINRFAKAMSDNFESEKEEVNQMVFDTPSNYEIVRIDSFEQAQEYSDYTSWCVTHDEYMFDSYTSDGINQFYFCLKHGFEHVEDIEGENCPLDEYGLSMIAISVNENGMLNTCTCRWNHDNGGNDNIMNSKEISQIISMNFFNVFKPNNIWRDLVNNAISRLNAGEPTYEVFDNVYYIRNYEIVKLRNKYNYLNKEGKILSPNQWFDRCDNFNHGFAMVELNDKYNFINYNGELLSPNQWFDGCSDFEEGFAIVNLNNKYNFISQEGKILLPNQWFDECYDFNEGFATVNLNGKWNFISQEGKILLPNQWFDRCYDFNNGICIVYLNGKKYYINTEGQIIDKVNENTNKQKKIYINESQLSLLTESQASKSEHQAVILVMNRFRYSKEQAYEFVHEKIRHDIYPLKDKELGKFILGVTRMCCDGELNDARAINDINATLILLKAHLNEYDRNLNGLSAQELISRFAQIRQDNLDAEKSKIDQMTFGESNYKIVPINSFEEAEQYYRYTYSESPWCITHMENMFETYTCDGINQIYFCLRNGFENEEPIVGENVPLDDYGLSMISVIVNENGELAHCTTRWNHKNGGTDNSMSAKGVSEVVGVNFYQVFKPNNKWSELIENVKQRIANGEPLDSVFDRVYNFSEGLAMVKLNKKCNYIKQDGEFLTDKWYDACSNFINGFGIVKSNNKCNFINQEGNLLSPNKWYDYCNEFKDGFGIVHLNDKCTYIKQDGEYLINEWFDYCESFSNGFAKVELNGKGYNFINANGKLLFPNQWFVTAKNFGNGLVKVELKHRFNVINSKGELVSPNQWFDYVLKFNNGFAEVNLNGKFNFINTDGEIISPNQWFDKVLILDNGFAAVRLKDKCNFINTNGKILSPNQWFDYVLKYNNGFAEVNLNGKFNFINTDGEIISPNQWFDKVLILDNGFAAVRLKDKFNFINTNGKILSPNQWFDYVLKYNNGFAVVVSNGRQYKISNSGELFDENGKKLNENIITTPKKIIEKILI